MISPIHQTFQTTVQQDKKTASVELPFSPADIWGARTRYDVTGTVNNHPVRGELVSIGNRYFLRLGAAWLRDSGVAVGETVTVTLALEGPQVDNLAEDIAAALLANQQAKLFFESLPTFYRKNYIRWIESAKRGETRARRIADMISLLEAGQRER